MFNLEKKIWFLGTVPVNKESLTGTVPVNKKFLQQQSLPITSSKKYRLKLRDIKGLFLDENLANFVKKKKTKIRLKLRTTNISGWFWHCSWFLQKGWNCKKLKTFEPRLIYLVLLRNKKNVAWVICHSSHKENVSIPTTSSNLQ